MYDLIVIYSCVAIASWYICSGWFFSKLMSISDREVRETAGMAIIAGLLYSILWPIGLPAAFLLTGFAEHGLWRRKKRN